ncbi:ribonuclease H-like domain-containing protein [Schizophyllum commune]
MADSRPSEVLEILDSERELVVRTVVNGETVAEVRERIDPPPSAMEEARELSILADVRLRRLIAAQHKIGALEEEAASLAAQAHDAKQALADHQAQAQQAQEEADSEILSKALRTRTQPLPAPTGTVPSIKRLIASIVLSNPTLPPLILPAMLPPILRIFAQTVEQAEHALNQYFSPDALAAAPCIGVDTEGYGKLDRQTKLADAPMPLSHHASGTYLFKHGIRLLQMAGPDAVIVMDLDAMGGIPPLAIQILSDPTVVKTGVNLSVDALQTIYREGHSLLNGVELSHLYKCIHPTPSMAPLAVQLSLAHLSQEILGHEVDKELQTSDWRADPLSEEQIYYAGSDALIAYLLYVALEADLPPAPWDGFSANAFTFNCAYVAQGRVVTPDDCCVHGRNVKLWGVFEDPASSSSWSPRHEHLALWSKGISHQFRNLPLAQFLQELARRRVAFQAELDRELLTYLAYQQSLA